MALSIGQIRNAATDADLLKLLQSELNLLFPPELRRDNVIFLSRLQAAPRGLRAMAATFELDVSLSLDDLAWHFINHHNFDSYEITINGLREIEAFEAAEIFEKAFFIVRSQWDELENYSLDKNSLLKWLEETGIQTRIDTLNDEMWKLLGQWPKIGLMHYWVSYARKYPERCVARD
jgi:hypothetical protein